MQNVLSTHHQKVLPMLYRLDPVHVALTERARLRQARAAVGIARRAIKPLRLWHRRQTTIRQLRCLCDWQLKDIGVVRGEIPAFVDALLAENTALGFAVDSKHRMAA
ncbi:MAG: hypothetical protein BMS9Abin10_0338 [Gammaproteobacteria bacterium]|nr:MAG: hypothetical protein BMS9Abin10_0338 [Gammaproteobacteria bacterium]